MTATRLLRPGCAALALLAAVSLVGLAFADDDRDAAARLKRFNDLKFGMFIHWGPYSLASVEASWPIMTPPRTGGITPDPHATVLAIDTR